LLVRTRVWRRLAARLKRLVDSNWRVAASRLSALKTMRHTLSSQEFLPPNHFVPWIH
jgi:hypothetical protein